MRVVYDHQLFSLQDVGGASRYHYELAHCLCTEAELSLEMVLGVQANLMPFSRVRNLRIWNLSLGVRIPPGVVRYALNEVFSTAFFAFRGKFDLYHPTLYRYLPLVKCRKMVATHYDCVQERFPQLFRNAQQIRNAKAKLYRRADAIICISESSRRDLHEFYDLDERKTFVVHLGVSPLQSSSSTKDTVQGLRGHPYILYVGSRAPYKNFCGLLNAFADSGLDKEFDLVVMGGGDLSDLEKALMLDRRLEHAVRVYPRPTDALISRAYAKSHLLVYPSLYEGFGFPPLEAMQFNCPALVSRSSSLPEVCRDAAFYFDPTCQDSLVAALKTACWNKAERARVIGQGKLVLNGYSWSECAKQTLSIYRA